MTWAWQIPAPTYSYSIFESKIVEPLKLTLIKFFFQSFNFLHTIFSVSQCHSENLCKVSVSPDVVRQCFVVWKPRKTSFIITKYREVEKEQISRLTDLILIRSYRQLRCQVMIKHAWIFIKECRAMWKENWTLSFILD